MFLHFYLHVPTVYAKLSEMRVKILFTPEYEMIIIRYIMVEKDIEIIKYLATQKSSVYCS